MPSSYRCLARAIARTVRSGAGGLQRFAAAQAGTTRVTLDRRALVQLRRGRFDDAIDDYDAALKINPNLAGALHGRGLARQKKGDNAGAEADMAAAKAIDGKVAEKFPKL